MKISTVVSLLLLIICAPLQEGMAQFRSDNNSEFDRTGHILRSDNPDAGSGLFGLQDFQMDHSYEMTMGSFGGNMYNQNMYTNTMHLLFNENLYGRVDLSVAHSPFGNNFMGQDNQAQFFIRNAELNYRFSDNARIQLRFQQLPAGYGYGRGFGYGGPAYHRSPFYHNPYSRW
ncbi:hypothetical protein QA596_11930 [Balneolales bacterium ANBcel1]|nr:hypothetical protein [Balneolales bacterium ANBcel1]